MPTSLSGTEWAYRGKSVSDKPDDKSLEAIKRHKPAQTFEMRTPGGASLRQGIANEVAEKDKARLDMNRADKYAKVEKEKIASEKDVLAGTRGRLSKEFNTQHSKERDS